MIFLQQAAQGVAFVITLTQDGAAQDVSPATTIQILLEKPDGTVVTKTAAFDSDGTDGKITYTTNATDLDAVGRWRIQGAVAWSGNSFKSAHGAFRVKANL